MTTDISVSSTQFQVENRSWLWGPHGTEPGTTPSVTLDISAFTEADHYPNGYIPSGTIIEETTDGLYGPYAGTGDTALILFSSVRVPTNGANVGGAAMVHGFVRPERLPFETGAGSLGTGGRDALPHIIFV